MINLAELRNDDVSVIAETRADQYPYILHTAVDYSALKCVRELLRLQPALVSCRRAGKEPIHRAVRPPIYRHEIGRRLEIISLLLAAGANVEAVQEIVGQLITIQCKPLETLIRYAQPPNFDSLSSESQAFHMSWMHQCGHMLIDAGADASYLPGAHSLRMYWKLRLQALERVKDARLALWVSLLKQRMPKDVAKLVLYAPELCNRRCWMAWYVFSYAKRKRRK